jgi:tetratricopeptide (TPR) repeat protein
MDGRLEAALAAYESENARAQELGVRRAGFDHTLAFWLGRGTDDALKELEIPVRPIRARRSLVLAYLGRFDEARAIREQFGDIGSKEDESGAEILLDLFEAALLGSDVETVRALMPRLAPMDRHLRLGFGRYFGGSVGRYLGAAAALLGRPDEARAYYQQALEVCARVRFRPEIAQIHLHFAELLLEHYSDEQAEALDHLDFAIEEFRAMKMQPALERALRHKGLLHA